MNICIYIYMNIYIYIYMFIIYIDIHACMQCHAQTNVTGLVAACVCARLRADASSLLAQVDLQMSRPAWEIDHLRCGFETGI